MNLLHILLTTPQTTSSSGAVAIDAEREAIDAEKTVRKYLDHLLNQVTKHL